MQSHEGSWRSLLTDIKKLRVLWPYLKRKGLFLYIAISMIPIITITQIYQPLIIQKVVDEGIAQRDIQAIEWLSFYLALAILIEYFARITQSLCTAYNVQSMVRILRRDLVKHVLALPLRYHDKSLSGRLVTRATSDFDNLTESISLGVVNAVVDFAVLLGCLIGMYLLEWRLALFATIIIPFVFLIVGWFSKKLKSSMHKTRAKLSELNAFTQECLVNHETVKLLTAGDSATNQYDKLNEKFCKTQMNVVTLDSILFSILEGLATVVIGLTLWLSVRVITSEATLLTAGVLIGFVRYIQKMFDPIKQLGSTLATLQGVFTSIDRIFSLLEEPLAEEQGLEKTKHIKGEIRFRRVSFAYNSFDGNVLTDLNFHITPGESLALVGKTGSGKSTVIKLLTKLYAGYKGLISIDGNDIRKLSAHSLRRQIAIVPQDIVLFEGSLAFNISLGQVDISREDIIQAAETVGLDKIVSDLPGGYDFEVNSQGSNLSHGQSQLIVFCRAIVKNPGLLILDEATSRIDPDSERLIQEAMRRILEGRTVIIIAHRLETIKLCDQILVLDKGALKESGNHQSLLQQNGLYAQMYHSHVAT